MDDKITEMLTKVNQDPEIFKTNGSYDFKKTIGGDINLLHIAVMENNLEVVKHLLDNGANIDAKTKDGHTVFDFLDSKCNNDMKNFLVEKSGKTCDEFEKLFKDRNFMNPFYKWSKKCGSNWDCQRTGGKSKRRKNKKSGKKSRRKTRK